MDLTQEVEVEIPVHPTGESPGVKEGGVLEQPLFQLHIKCLPAEVPEGIDADISGLRIGDALRVGDLVADAKFEILTDPETIVASVAAPISEEQLQAMDAAAGQEAAAAEVTEVAEAAPIEGEQAPPEQPSGEPTEGGSDAASSS